MKLEELREGIVKSWDVKPLDLDPIEALSKYCKSAETMIANGTVLWRGDAGHKLKLIDPRTGIRTSKSSDNFYQQLMDASSHLKSYPSRSNSLICSSSKKVAEGYASGGNSLYAVFPVDGTEIAVHPSDDFLYHEIDVFGVQTELSSLAARVNLNVKLPFERIKFMTLDEIEKSIDYSAITNKTLMSRFALQNRGKFLQALADKIMTPENLQISLVKPGDPLPRLSECWFSNRAVMMSDRLFNDVIREFSRKKLKIHDKY